MKLSKLIVDFLEYLEIERNASQMTIRNYDHYLARFLSFAKNIDPEKIDLELVRKYRVYLARYVDETTGLSLKKVTQNYFLIALRAFLKYLARRDIETLSAEKIELGKQDPRPIKILDPENLERLLSAPEISTDEGLRDKALLETLFSTGLRVSELVKLNRDQINLGRAEFGVIGKGGKERVVFLSDMAVEWIERYLAKRADDWRPLFIRYSGSKKAEKSGENMRLSVRSVERIIEKYIKKMRIPIKATPHTLRHSFATDLLINGADIRSVQEMLGHASISTTQRYTEVNLDYLMKLYDSAHPHAKISN